MAKYEMLYLLNNDLTDGRRFETMTGTKVKFQGTGWRFNHLDFSNASTINVSGGASVDVSGKVTYSSTENPPMLAITGLP